MNFLLLYIDLIVVATISIGFAFCLGILAMIAAVGGFALALYLEPQLLIPLYFTELPLLCRIYLTAIMIPFSCHYVVTMYRIVLPLTKFLMVHLPLMVLAETITDEYCAYIHSTDEPPSPIGNITEGNWELVAVLRSSNNGYGSKQFYPALVCDSDQRDDPFWPRHVSVVHVIEIRRHSIMETEVIVRRVSLLSGDQMWLHTFDLGFVPDVPFSRRFRSGKVKCFQSGGVVFSSILGDNGLLLMVYDSRNKKHAFYDCMWTDLSQFHQRMKIVSITCLGRPPNGIEVIKIGDWMSHTSGDEKGWRIRILHADVQMDHANANASVVLVSSTFDLRRAAKLVNRTAVLMGNFNRPPILKIIRASDGSVGVFAENPDIHDGPIMLYDHSAQSYVYFERRQDLVNFDRPFASYVQKPPPSDGDRDYDMCPTVLNNRECIKALENGMIYRKSYAPPSMLFASAKKIFRVAPGLRSRINADQFRQMTGIGGMEPHFG